jgi:hypothetical protein
MPKEAQMDEKPDLRRIKLPELIDNHTKLLYKLCAFAIFQMWLIDTITDFSWLRIGLEVAIVMTCYFSWMYTNFKAEKNAYDCGVTFIEYLHEIRSVDEVKIKLRIISAIKLQNDFSDKVGDYIAKLPF